ncbi:MAG: hypothetical protein AMK73_07925 [Planctomycetes bacterium SM23_32]|nr:MAG: hypothetical protein AMK73_07925 [Planctomycetes bacterium SM23_32]
MRAERTSVLLIERDSDDAAQVRRMLQQADGGSFEVHWARKPSTGLARVRQGAADVVLLALSAGAGRSLELLARINATMPRVPVIVLTSVDDSELAVDALQGGAQDHLVKGELDGRLLARSIRYAVERKLTEEALRESEEKFRALAEQSPNMIFIHAGGHIAYANPRCAELTGYSREELLAPEFGVLDLVASESAELMAESYRRHVAGEEVPAVEFTVLTKSGQPMHALLATKLIAYQGMTGILGTVTDLTDRKQVEDALRQAVRHWEETFDAIEDMVYILDPEFRIVRANRAMLEGLPGPETVGRHCYEVFHGTDRPPAGCPGCATVEAGQAAHAEIVEPHLGGRVFDLHTYPGFDGAGTVQYLVHVARDVTDRKRTEDALKASGEAERALSARLRALHEVSNELSNADTVDEVCRLAVVRGRERLGFDRLGIWLVDIADSSCVVGTWGAGEDGQLRDERSSRVRIDDRANLRTMVYEKKMLTVMRRAGLRDNRGTTVGRGTNALAALWDGEKVIGYVAMDNLLEGRPVTKHDLEVLRLYASALGHLCTRKRAEEALRRGEERLREAQRTARIGSWEFNVESRRITWSEEGYRLFERDPADGPPTYEENLACYYPHDAERLTSQVQRAIEFGEEFDSDYHLKLPGGRSVYQRGLIRVAKDEQGRAVKLFGTVQDITERKESERELLRERQFSNAVIDTSGALIVVLDPEGRVVRFNMACERTTGYNARDVTGRPIWELLIPPEERQGVEDVFSNLAAGGTFSTYENHWLAKDGDKRLIAWANTRVLDEQGRVQYVIGTGIDVTEQRQLEAQLRRAAKLEAVGQLAGGIAHDFNNLLTAILGYVDLNLPDLEEGSQLRQDLMQVRAAARRASDLTRQLLTFGRQQPAVREVVDLNETVRDVCKMLGHLIEENVELQVVTCEEPLKVKADPAQIGQVLMNLAVNARDAMPDGGVLAVRTSAVVKEEDPTDTQTGFGPGAYALLTVRDTGTGMPYDVQERIYDPFFTTKGVGQGTGLGLSTVYGVVEQSGGYIECISEPGAGTTFEIHLPLVEAGEPAQSVRSELGIKFGGHETILLVEDEPEIRQLGARTLKDLGYRVLCAAGGPEALALLRRHRGRLDLLLTDVVMPRMAGHDLAARVHDIRPGAKLLFMTGYAEKDDGALGGAVDSTGLLRKPFTAAKLAKQVRAVLDEHRGEE